MDMYIERMVFIPTSALIDKTAEERNSMAHAARRQLALELIEVIEEFIDVRIYEQHFKENGFKFIGSITLNSPSHRDDKHFDQMFHKLKGHQKELPAPAKQLTQSKHKRS